MTQKHTKKTQNYTCMTQKQYLALLSGKHEQFRNNAQRIQNNTKTEAREGFGEEETCPLSAWLSQKRPRWRPNPNF